MAILITDVGHFDGILYVPLFPYWMALISTILG
jgi:hypothetical protein